MVQYYRNMWAKRSEMLAPLSEQESAEKRKPPGKLSKIETLALGFNSSNSIWQCKIYHHKKVVLAYSCFSKPFEVYTDASTLQLGAVITQENRPIAFFSRKLSGAQSKYTITY